MSEIASALARAKALLAGDTTCVLIRGDECLTSTLRGVKPLIGWLDSGVRGGVAADKVVGKAAAFLYVLLDVRAVYADVISASAEEVLRAYHIAAAYGTRTERIVNRTGDEFCPMETATLTQTDPVRALEKIRETMRALASEQSTPC